MQYYTRLFHDTRVPYDILDEEFTVYEEAECYSEELYQRLMKQREEEMNKYEDHAFSVPATANTAHLFGKLLERDSSCEDIADVRVFLLGGIAPSVMKRLREEQQKQEAAQNGGNKKPAPSYSGGALLWPCDSTIITSEFGYRIHPLTGIYTGHTGIDIGCSMNSPIYAAEAGTVILSEWYGGYGYAVVVDHGGGITTLYGHNDYCIAQVGDRVERGDVIASSGNTGWSTGPHLHFEVRVNGDYVDPMGYF